MPPAARNEGALRAIARQALTHWDLEERELRLISLSENAVFRLDAAGGGTYAVRIHRPGYSSLEALNSELLWTTALREAGLDVPAAVRTRSGDGYATVTLDDGSVRHVGVVGWIKGTLLSATIEQERDHGVIAEHYERLGALAARVHNQASGWCPPPGFVRRAWDADGLMGPDPLWGRFWEVPQLELPERELLMRVRAALHDALCAYGTTDAIYSLIHADLHPYNVLVAGDRLNVIDFDDAGFGWHLYELGVALFAAQLRPYFEVVVDAMVAGYRAERDLSEPDLRLLPMFLLIRGLASLGWTHGRTELGLESRMAPLIERTTAQAEVFLSGRLQL